MNPNEGSSNKISLSMLRGKSSNQSVPSISFRFNTGTEDLIKLDEKNEKEDLSSNTIQELSPEREGISPESSLTSSRRESRGLSQRSSSLDESTTCGASETSSPKTSDGGSLISRLTKTFEHKINEIRNDKQREKEYKQFMKESLDHGSSDQSNVHSESDKLVATTTKALESMKRFSLENRESSETSSPSKSKTSLVQDFTELTNKLESDFNKNIRPKISELRNRKSPKDSTSSPKIRSSLFQSLLGRDEGLTTEDLLECHAVDTAVEAHEDGEELIETKNSSPKKSTCKEPSAPLTRQEHLHPLPTSLTSELPHMYKAQTIDTASFDPREILIRFIKETLIKRKSVFTKCGLAIFIVCFILPLPRFFAGVLFGVALVSFLFLFLVQFFMPQTKETFEGDIFLEPVKEIYKVEENRLYDGLMNELDGEYYPESYHVSQTHTVLLRLQGSILKIDNSRKKISKHARPNENLQYGSFVHHREYDLTGCEVLLVPKNLPRRWLWSRKYPILIRLQHKPNSPTPESLPSTPNIPFQETSSRPHSPEEVEESSESTEGNWSLQINRSAIEDDLMSSSLDLGSYEEVTQDMCLETSLCLFARTDREKDDWFRRFVGASQRKSEAKTSVSWPLFTCTTPEAEISVPFEGTPPESESEINSYFEEDKRELKTPSFDHHIARIMELSSLANEGVSWLNCFIGRLFFDFLHDQYWANKIQERVQRKLSKLHIPYFVGEIVVCGVELGNCLPQLLSAGAPSVDTRGLWVDLQVAYSGSFRMTIETKLDLMKLKARSSSGTASGVHSSNPPSPNEAPPSPYPSARTRASYARSPSSDCVLRNLQFDTDTDDSVESSSEEEMNDDDVGERGLAGTGAGGSGGPASKRFLRIVDTVAASRYFQQASEWRVLQRAMKGVSNTRIELSVEVKRLKGTLALNVPPAPSDRLWYGFRGSPELVMVAKPCLGDRQLDTLPFLADFIQKQLRTVFEKVFVLPNMDDLVIPIMSPLLPGQKHAPRPPWETRFPQERGTPSPKTSPSRSNVSLELNQSFLKLSKMAEEL